MGISRSDSSALRALCGAFERVYGSFSPSMLSCSGAQPLKKGARNQTIKRAPFRAAKNYLRE